jgi:cellulose synthase/poly-beta-1,6-N-acetylglucosamine synthase-like glycosyltransferase
MGIEKKGWRMARSTVQTRIDQNVVEVWVYRERSAGNLWLRISKSVFEPRLNSLNGESRQEKKDGWVQNANINLILNCRSHCCIQRRGGHRRYNSRVQRSLTRSDILIVDRISNDKTVEIAKELGAEILFQKGRWKGNAISEGLSFIDGYPRYVVFTDADFTYPAKYVLEMIRILNKNPRVGMVTGNRFNQSLNSSAMKNPFCAGNRLIAFTQRVLNGVDLEDPLTGLRVIRWEILKGWKPTS